MCGSVQLSVMERQRLKDLRNLPGSAFSGHVSKVIPNITGKPFAGFARKESLRRVWKKRIREEHYVEIEGFKEKGRYFERPGYVRIVVVDSRDGGEESRIVTGPADVEISRIHHRQPLMYRRTA